MRRAWEGTVNERCRPVNEQIASTERTATVWLRRPAGTEALGAETPRGGEHVMPEIETDPSVPEASRAGHRGKEPDTPDVSPSTWSLVRGEPHLHPFRFAGVAGKAARVVGVRDDHGVTLGGGRVHIRFGPWVLDTPATNVARVHVTGPYHLWKVAGPPHLSFADRGVTFATNADAGVCIGFVEPVPAIGPFGLLRHPAATATVQDVERLEEVLRRYLDER
jgi:hypothetical protein